MFYELYVKRAINSLVNVSVINQKGRDLLLKIITILNLIKKFLGANSALTVWKFDDCIIKVRFLGESYYFYLPRGYDFNIFLNPYFHEYDITQLVFRALSAGDTFLDVGAHGGLYTIIAGKKVKETGKVLCFEPNPMNLKFLRLNIRLNGLSNVNVIPKAVGDRTGKVVLFYSTYKTACTSAKHNGENMIEVDITTIDEIAEKLDLIKIMKVDTEGMDWYVLRGASKTLHKVRFVIVEQNTPNIRKLLLDTGFQLSTLRPSGYLFAINKTIQKRSVTSIILESTGEMLRTHVIRHLFNALRSILGKPDDIDQFVSKNRSLLIRLEGAYINSRCVSREYEREEAEELVSFAEEAIEFVKSLTGKAQA